MRLLPVALALTVVPVAAAQISVSHQPDTGLYSEAGVGVGYGGASVGLMTTGSGALGYRLPSGLALGAHGSVFSAGTEHTSFAIGPEIRYSQSLDDRTTLDLHASGSAGFYQGIALESAGYQPTGVGLQVGGAATRRFGLGRGVTFAATGGLFGGVTHTFDTEFAPGVGSGRAAGPGAYAGVTLGAQVEFNALGGRFSIGPYGSVPLVTTGRALGAGTGIHRVGGGQSRSFITFQF